MENFDQQIEALKKSVLFNLSLSSKELFHSNFLAWFIEAYPERGLQFANDMIGEYFFETGGLSADNSPEVKREEKNIDLQIVWGGKTLIIENKVKSIPCSEQLDGYSKGCNSDTTRFVLLSLTDPIFFRNRQHKTPDGHIWQWVDYKMMLDRLTARCPRGYDGLVVQDYCRFISVLNDIAQKSMEAFSPPNNFLDYSKDSLYEKLHTVRLHDLFDKWRFTWLERELRGRPEYQRLKNKAFQSTGAKLEISSAMTNATGLLEAKYIIENGATNSVINIGVQLQGRSLRQFIQVPASADTALKYANKLANVARSWFVGELKPTEKTKIPGFCSYSGTFLYRQEILGEPPADADAICAKIMGLLEVAATNLNTLKNFENV